MRIIQAFPLALLALICSLVPKAFAQRTVTRDIGSGRKIVLHYNAAGQVTETETIGANGELQQKDEAEYRPGYYTPQATSTAYWPNGKVHKLTENRYDANGNFLGEFLRVYDEQGSQTGGHRITHDPISNVYICSAWNAAAQSYKPTECPSGEEAGSAPETVKKFTQSEVEGQLQRAREAAQKTTPAIAATKAGEFALVLPADFKVGERISGRLVDDGANYENTPSLVVTRIPLPPGTVLDGAKITLADNAPQPADRPIAFTAPRHNSELPVSFQPGGNAAPITATVKLAPGASARQKDNAGYLAPATCLKDRACIVSGAFSGDATTTFAAVDDQPAEIVAETLTSVYVAIPESIPAGAQGLFIADGSKTIAFPVAVSRLQVRADRSNPKQAENFLVYITLDGPDGIPDSEWRAGNYPATNLTEARKLIPAYQEPRGRKNAGEKQDEDKHEQEGAGEILIVVRNTMPEAAAFRDSKDGMYVFHLRDDAFKMGEFKYRFVVEPKQAGTFGVEAVAIPFLAPVQGQQFTTNAGK